MKTHSQKNILPMNLSLKEIVCYMLYQGQDWLLANFLKWELATKGMDLAIASGHSKKDYQQTTYL